MDDYTVIEHTGHAWEPGPGFYVARGIDAEEYMAYCGPLTLEAAREDAEHIVAALNAAR